MLTVTKDFTKDFNKIIASFKRDEVLVGIPEAKGPRKDDAEINNAALLAIANFGSPINNIPAWPVMSIGIKAAQDDIAAQFKLAAVKALTDGHSAVDQYYDRAGSIASTSIKNVLTDQVQVPADKPEASTLRARKYTTKAGFVGTKYWLVTGQLRNAITWVLRGGR